MNEREQRAMDQRNQAIINLTAEYSRVRAALTAIAAMPDEDDEWVGRDKFREARAIAQNALSETM